VLPLTREEKLQSFLQKVENKVVDLIDTSTIIVANKKVIPSLLRFHLASQIVMKHKSYQSNWKKCSRGRF
jgi:hypothetical protein